MATNSSTIRGVVNLQKRLVNHIRTTCDSHPPPHSSFRRKAHSFVYEKNIDEHVRPAVVPDEAAHQKCEYWAPHPYTGVFGPASPQASPATYARARAPPSSVLQQKAFFRDLENLDKPNDHP